MTKNGLVQGQNHCFFDEMRVSLQGFVRRVWSSRGFKIVQKVQFVFQKTYLALAVNPITGRMKWNWVESMKSSDLHPILENWQIDSLICDRASAHRSDAFEKLGFVPILQPAYSPELNPVERIFEELRKLIEGKVYPSLKAKKLAVEAELRRLAARPDKVKQIAAWGWICDTLHALPES